MYEQHQVPLPTGVNLQERGFVIISAEYKKIEVFYDKILSINSLKGYVKIFTGSKPYPYLPRLNLKAMEAKLPAALFCKGHHSYIVLLNKITDFKRLCLHVGKQEIPISQRYLAEFERKYAIINEQLCTR